MSVDIQLRCQPIINQCVVVIVHRNSIDLVMRNISTANINHSGGSLNNVKELNMINLTIFNHTANLHQKETVIRVLNCAMSTAVLFAVTAPLTSMADLRNKPYAGSEVTWHEKNRKANHQRNPKNIIVSKEISLDGTGNNSAYPQRGTVGQLYSRVAPAAYADGISAMQVGPELRYLSNRIFADGAQNLFSENSVTQWAYNWGQFIDHTIGLRAEGGETVEVPFDETDPLEFFTNSQENLWVSRSAPATDTGITTPREQINTVSSYIDGWAVYGGTSERLEWLRAGPVDGDLSNNSAKLLLTDEGYLPPASYRGDASSAPQMERVGMLRAIPDADDIAVIAGDKRANENIALTTIQTLFAREHNRIVDLLPQNMPEQNKFDIARRLIIATQQYITYNEFLPAIGVAVDQPTSYDPTVDPSVSHEFATVGYRAHSMIHGEIEMAVAADHFTPGILDDLRTQGIEVTSENDEVEIAVPLNVAFANPALVETLGLGPIAAGLGGEPQYKNDETIDNQLRSVLFQLPNPEIANPDACLDGIELPSCYLLAGDVGVLDVFRARDHGIPDYNTLREAYGLNRISTFTELTGESTEEFPADDPMIDNDYPINDPDIMEYVLLKDVNGNELALDSEAAEGEAVVGIRRTTLAARLKAIYGTTDNIDAFVGMVSEPHIDGSELGELQHAMWKTQFEALRDGDSNFYLWADDLKELQRSLNRLGISYRQTLADIIVNNTNLESDDIQSNMFISVD